MLPMIKGFQDAGRQLGLDVTFRGNPETNDFAAAPVVKRLLEDAIATKPDAIVVSDQFPDVLNGDIKQAVSDGIPVVLTNGGYGEEGNVGALAFVGTAERDLGQIGAQRLCGLGAKNVLVVTLPPGIPLVDLRMEGIAKGIAPCKTTVIQVPQETLFDATKLVNTMLVAIQKDPTIDGVFRSAAAVVRPWWRWSTSSATEPNRCISAPSTSELPCSMRSRAGRSTSRSTSSNILRGTCRW
jgi:simple sugar transport system substrate-binding protein